MRFCLILSSNSKFGGNDGALPSIHRKKRLFSGADNASFILRCISNIKI
jgi:hypothetical protein